MKLKRLILGIACAALLIGGCNDEVNLVGPSIQPEEDKITVYTDTFRFEASTIYMDAVYAKSDTGLLGEFFDPLYGTLKSDYISQFYCPEEYTFNDKPMDGIIDSIDFRVFYRSWVGDSLTPMKAQIYMISEPLDKHYYTDMNPEDYCDMQTILGSKTYTAVDLSVPEEDRNSQYYAPNVRIKLSKELGQKFYDETINNPSTFASQDAFNKFLPGFYITNTFGSGNMLKVSNSYLTIYYRTVLESSTGQDSIVNSQELFNTTKEVIQLHRFKNSNMEELVKPNDAYTFIKTPAGVCTRLVLPVKKAKPILEGRILNDLPFTVTAMPQEEWNFALTPPTKLLMIPEDSVKVFFEEGKYPNDTTTFVSRAYNATLKTYTFGNISKLLDYQIKNHPDEDLRLLLIPVNHKQETDYYGYTRTTDISHYLSPAGVKLRMDDETLEFVVTSCKYYY